MDKYNQNLNKEDKKVVGVVHVLLSHDYAIFFLAVVLGVIFDVIFTVHVFNSIVYEYIGLFMIFIGSLVIYWAQRTTGSSNNEIGKERDINFFFRGPYKYTRNPTNFGLTFAVLGFGLLINSLFSIIFILITYIISKLIFIKKQDNILKDRYGAVYEEYLKKVKDWL